MFSKLSVKIESFFFLIQTQSFFILKITRNETRLSSQQMITKQCNSKTNESIELYSVDINQNIFTSDIYQPNSSIFEIRSIQLQSNEVSMVSKEALHTCFFSGEKRPLEGCLGLE